MIRRDRGHDVPVALTAAQFVRTARRSDKVFLALVSLNDEETSTWEAGGDLDPDVRAILEKVDALHAGKHHTSKPVRALRAATGAIGTLVRLTG